MSNHGYITLAKKSFPKLGLDANLLDINNRRFDSRLFIMPWNAEENGGVWGWNIVYEMFQFPLWLASSRKIAVSHKASGWFWWVDVVYRHELASIYGGTISDDADNDRITPIPNAFPTIRSWFEFEASNFGLHGITRRDFVKRELSYVPKDIQRIKPRNYGNRIHAAPARSLQHGSRP